MRDRLTVPKRQMDVLRFIDSFVDEHNKSPTAEEIKEGIGIESKGAAHGHLSRLRDRGLVTWVKYEFRTIRLTEAGTEQVRKGLPF
ncbi:putative transcriptional regulator [Paenibacillus sp. 598K]|uniref:LexA family protein n=1 Tax=Paenibacillus sp. 598K TaxID=1117987 RepID=UPI000FFA989E|nr:hypothetical protein [Paenibacillus sp. 598K]GBF73139.1 putative transcriptional regulator [Paenibacillus sp. 598K]